MKATLKHGPEYEADEKLSAAERVDADRLLHEAVEWWNRTPGEWEKWQRTPRALASKRAVWPFG